MCFFFISLTVHMNEWRNIKVLITTKIHQTTNPSSCSSPKTNRSRNRNFSPLFWPPPTTIPPSHSSPFQPLLDSLKPQLPPKTLRRSTPLLCSHLLCTGSNFPREALQRRSNGKATTHELRHLPQQLLDQWVVASDSDTETRVPWNTAAQQHGDDLQQLRREAQVLDQSLDIGRRGETARAGYGEGWCRETARAGDSNGRDGETTRTGDREWRDGEAACAGDRKRWDGETTCAGNRKRRDRETARAGNRKRRDGEAARKTSRK